MVVGDDLRPPWPRPPRRVLRRRRLRLPLLALRLRFERTRAHLRILFYDVAACLLKLAIAPSVLLQPCDDEDDDDEDAVHPKPHDEHREEPIRVARVEGGIRLRRIEGGSRSATLDRDAAKPVASEIVGRVRGQVRRPAHHPLAQQANFGARLKADDDKAEREAEEDVEIDDRRVRNGRKPLGDSVLEGHHSEHHRQDDRHAIGDEMRLDRVRGEHARRDEEERDEYVGDPEAGAARDRQVHVDFGVDVARGGGGRVRLAHLKIDVAVEAVLGRLHKIPRCKRDDALLARILDEQDAVVLRAAALPPRFERDVQILHVEREALQLHHLLEDASELAIPGDLRALL